MSDIFVSYTREDISRVEPFVQLFEQRGWSVWWDRNIPVGKAFDEVIEMELAAAHCAIVIWSKSSVGSSWVKAEAAEAAKRKILIPVLIDAGVSIPLGFRQIQTAQLAAWDGKSAHHELENVLNAVASILDKNPWKPPVDIARTVDGYLVVMDLPGLNSEDLEVSIESSRLTVRGTQRVTMFGDPGNFILAERKGRKFCRTLSLPEDLSETTLDRDYVDGVLILQLGTEAKNRD